MMMRREALALLMALSALGGCEKKATAPMSWQRVATQRAQQTHTSLRGDDACRASLASAPTLGDAPHQALNTWPCAYDDARAQAPHPDYKLVKIAYEQDAAAILFLAPRQAVPFEASAGMALLGLSDEGAQVIPGMWHQDALPVLRLRALPAPETGPRPIGVDLIASGEGAQATLSQVVIYLDSPSAHKLAVAPASPAGEGYVLPASDLTTEWREDRFTITRTLTELTVLAPQTSPGATRPTVARFDLGEDLRTRRPEAMERAVLDLARKQRASDDQAPARFALRWPRTSPMQLIYTLHQATAPASDALAIELEVYRTTSLRTPGSQHADTGMMALLVEARAIEAPLESSDEPGSSPLEVLILPDGINVIDRTTGEPLAPVAPCPAEGPTLCLDGPGADPVDVFARAAQLDLIHETQQASDALDQAIARYGLHRLYNLLHARASGFTQDPILMITVHADLPLMLLTRALDVAMVQRAAPEDPQRCLDTIASHEALRDTTPCKLEGEVGRFVAARLIAP